jgi:hypothetical protein
VNFRFFTNNRNSLAQRYVRYLMICTHLTASISFAD